MGCMKYALEMNYGQVRLTIFMDFRFHHPEPSFIFWFITNDREPLNKGAWIRSPLMQKGKEQENATNFQPTHPWQFWSCIDENTIIAGRTFSPCWSRTNVFAPHATGPTGVTGSLKSGHRTKKNRDFPPKIWACIDRDTGGWNSCMRINLVVEKTAKELWEFRQFQLVACRCQIPLQA